MAKRDIALIIHDGVQALDVAGPLDVFSTANMFVAEGDGYNCLLIGEGKSPVRTSNGMLLMAHLSFEEACRPFHTVLVAGGPALPDAAADASTSQWLRRWGNRAERYGSICTGAFALGHAGLLDGRNAATHWQSAGKLAAMFPTARVEHDRIYVRDDRLVTSAGVTAGIDLALALVGEDHGAAVSLACAKGLLVVAQRQGGQSQFSPLLVPMSDPVTPLGKVQAYVLEHPNEPFSVERLAVIAGTSERSIARLFVSELGVTPHDFIEGVRLDQARNLLESTDLSLKSVAFDCGFATPERMRGAFQRRLGVSPLQYRESFRATFRETSQDITT
ncbi:MULTISPECIES: GlxA family transcriptional regulator [unclassified Bradyrhizobium]|uniref:GlxA family transcriptional regulator n=1 Tax=unclassified Bradyrhizobium TaxID=2631580 RepID=UPI00188D9B2C|nr:MULTISPECIES: GlxA family transcriptional regulator [unclassified Bradyrhizobium]MDN4984165.1 GlxA family transcriptional regulator [Bradyrhizobium sp. WYCCWR 13022]QOZ51676.1 AraC family transcriptional regulator [Bradyrhizobium sp. CCBAU 53338]